MRKTDIEKLEKFRDKGWTYNAKTGEITSHTGRIITGKNSSGYIQCNLGTGSKILTVTAHRLAWFLTYDQVPNVIDHIDRDKTNNKIENLRDVNLQKNQWNRCDGKGYRFHKGAWNAHIVVSGKQIHLGCFRTENEAREAYLQAKKTYHTI